MLIQLSEGSDGLGQAAASCKDPSMTVEPYFNQRFCLQTHGGGRTLDGNLEFTLGSERFKSERRSDGSD